MGSRAIVRVLVVDDEEDVRDLIGEMLAEESIETFFAADGEEALELLGKAHCDLLLTDLRMPKIDGFELVRRARRMQPDLRVLYMSGYATQYKIDVTQDDFVAKPFRRRELIGCIYEILSRGGGPTLRG